MISIPQYTVFPSSALFSKDVITPLYPYKYPTTKETKEIIHVIGRCPL
ncbi:hypothetical protein IJU97_00240 [bacterium]|nr:hypothetical protein [bacterium]